ncbi:MAG: hypothetical protein JO138_05210 [Acidobacteriaceae bacterium]|nr:hypothetical protein [Acidobacteriaceae bacterium]
MDTVQRLLAILLLFAFTFPLMPLPAITRTDSSLPACCRKNGKHKCALKDAALRQGSAPAIAGVEERCPARPAFFTRVTSSHALLFEPSPLHSGPVLIQTVPPARTDALGTLPVSGSHQKRGPPVLVLHQFF